MIRASLLAVAVAGQVGAEPAPQIDVDYTPKVNDRALLGTWNNASPGDAIQRALCYASIDDAKAAIKAIGESVAEGGLSSTPDAYVPRAGTPIIIKEVLAVDVDIAGVRRGMSMLKVRVLEGEFKGKELFTVPRSVFKELRPGARNAAHNAQTKGQAQSQSVIEARKARRTAANQRQASRDAAAAVEHQQQMVEYEKAVKAQREYEIKMGPTWAAEHANQIQQQRNALIAQRNAIEKQKADYDAWILWQLRNQQPR